MVDEDMTQVSTVEAINLVRHSVKGNGQSVSMSQDIQLISSVGPQILSCTQSWEPSG